MAKNSFLLYNDLDEVVQSMSNEQAGVFLKAIFDYQMGREISLPQDLKFMFVVVKNQLDRDNNKYDKVVENRMLAGKRSAESRRQKKVEQIEQVSTSVSTCYQVSTNSTVNVNDNDNVNVNGNDITNTLREGMGGNLEKSEPKQKTKKNTKTPPVAATPPSIEDVIDFFATKGFDAAHATKAFEYYNSAGWQDSRGKPVLNWKQKFIANWLDPQRKAKPEQQGESTMDVLRRHAEQAKIRLIQE